MRKPTFRETRSKCTHATTHARVPGARDWRRHVLSLRKYEVSTKLHDVTVKTVEGGAGSLNNAPIIHADKRAYVSRIPIFLPFPRRPAAPWHHTHKYAHCRRATTHSRTEIYTASRKWHPAREIFVVTREKWYVKYIYTYTLSAIPRRVQIFIGRHLGGFIAQIKLFPNKYDFVRGEKSS